MQNVGTALFNILSGDTRDLQDVDLFEFYPPEETDLCPANAEKRFAATEIEWLGWKYEQQAITRSDISKFIDGRFNNVTITLSNVDRTVATWLSTIDLDGYRVIIRCISRSVDNDSINLGTFRCDNPDDSNNTTVSISCKQDLGSINNDLPFTIIQEKCPLEFKGTECLAGQLLGSKSATYQAATVCNKSNRQCDQYGNLPAFQGHYFNGVTGNFKVSQRRGGAGGAALSLIGLGNKRVTKQYSSQDDTPRGKPWPMGLGRTQIELVLLQSADTGEYLAGQWSPGEGEIGKFLNLRPVSAGWASTFQALATHRGKYGFDAEQAPAGFFTSTGQRHSHKAFVEATIKGDNPDTGDPAPTLVSVILWIKIPTWNGSSFSGEDWTDDPIAHVRYLLTEIRGLGYSTAWIDDEVSGQTSEECARPLIDQTGGEDVYVSTASGTPGTDYKRYRSTGILDTWYYRKLLGLTAEYSAEREVPYNTFNAANPPTNITPGTYYRKQYTSNFHLKDSIRVTDFLFKSLLPSFNGYLTTSAQGKLQIKTLKRAITSNLRANVSTGATSIQIDDAKAWRSMDVPVKYALIGVGTATSETRLVVAADYSTAANSITVTTSGSVASDGATLSGGTADTQAQAVLTVSGASGTFTVTIGGTPISYTANGNDTTATVAALLAVRINADPTINEYIEAIWTVAQGAYLIVRSKIGTLTVAALDFAHTTADLAAHVHMVFSDVAFGALTRGNILKDSFKYPLRSKQANYNQFILNFSDAVQDFQPTRLEENDYAHQRKINKKNEIEIGGECVDNYHQADRLVLGARYKLREGNFFCSWDSIGLPLLLEEGDLVCVNHSSMPGKRNLMLRIEEARVAQNHKVSLTGRLYADAQFPQSAEERTISLTTGSGFASTPPPAIQNLVLTSPTAGAINGSFDFGAYLGSQQAKIEIQLPGAAGFTDTGIRISPDSQNKGNFQIPGVTPGLSYVRVTPYSSAGNGPETIGSRDTAPTLAAVVAAVSAVSGTASGGTGSATIAAVVAAVSTVSGTASGGTGSVQIAGTIAAVSSVTAALATEGDPNAGFHYAARFMALSNDASVVSLPDESGNNRHATQASSGDRAIFKTNVVNGQPSVRFTGAQWYVIPDWMGALTEGEVFVVFRNNADPASTSAKSGLMQLGDDNAQASHYPFTDGTIYSDFGSTARKTAGNPSASTTTITLLNISSKAGEWTMRINGVELFTTATNTVAFPTGSHIAQLGREQSDFGTVYLDGDWFETLFFPTVRTGGERDAIESALGTVYGQSW
jgi:phage-related protein